MYRIHFVIRYEMGKTKKGPFSGAFVWYFYKITVYFMLYQSSPVTVKVKVVEIGICKNSAHCFFFYRCNIKDNFILNKSFFLFFILIYCYHCRTKQLNH